MAAVRGRRSTQLVTMYVLSLVASVVLLVVWVIYVVRSGSRLADLVRGGERVNWLVLIVGCVLLFFLIVGLTYQLAQALAARRYALKQEEFLSNITHEMKSPLAAIKLHAQTLQEDEPPEEIRRRFLATIEQQADHMSALVDSVLESSRLLAGKRQLELAPVRLDEFLRFYLPAAARRAEAHGVRLAARVESGALVLATEEALRTVLDNLVDNAVRFSVAGGEVRVRVGVDAGVARIEVEDDGPGIPQQDLPFVFDRFYQGGHEGEPQRRGTGLGLAIVAGLVREMHGSVSAFAEAGRRGTRMVVELPLTARRAEAAG
jgi:signal transduction histidine kinase